MARYVLLGGNVAFIGGRRVDPGQVFEIPDGEKPPRMSRQLAEDEPAPEAEEVPEKGTTMSEMQIGNKVVARASDVEPV